MEEGVKLTERRVCCWSFEGWFNDGDDNKLEKLIIVVVGGERDVVWVDCTEHLGLLVLPGGDKDPSLLETLLLLLWLLKFIWSECSVVYLNTDGLR